MTFDMIYLELAAFIIFEIISFALTRQTYPPKKYYLDFLFRVALVLFTLIQDLEIDKTQGITKHDMELVLKTLLVSQYGQIIFSHFGIKATSRGIETHNQIEDIIKTKEP